MTWKYGFVHLLLYNQLYFHLLSKVTYKWGLWLHVFGPSTCRPLIFLNPTQPNCSPINSLQNFLFYQLEHILSDNKSSPEYWVSLWFCDWRYALIYEAVYSHTLYIYTNRNMNELILSVTFCNQFWKTNSFTNLNDFFSVDSLDSI